MSATSIASPALKAHLLINNTGSYVATAGLFLIVVILWLPFGFAVPFSADGWTMINTVDQGIFIPVLSRPFAYLPYAVAHLLSPNLFLGLNIILAGVMFGKAVLLYLLLRRLFENRAFAFAVGALVLVLPADTAIFNEGTFSIHVALFFYIAAVYLLVVYWQQKRWYFLPLIWLALAVTTGIYETVYPLILFTPLLLVWEEKRLSQRVMRVSLLWYAVPTVALLRFGLLAVQNQNAVAYQSGLYTGFAPVDMVVSLARAYGVQLGWGWIRSRQLLFPGYSVLAGLISGAICGLLPLQQRVFSRKLIVLLLLTGLAIIGLGYAPYLPTALRNNSDRTFFYSSLGGALFFVAASWALAQALPLKRIVFASLITLLVGLGMSQVLDQHQKYRDYGAAELPLLRSIVTQAPVVQPGTLLLVIDESNNHAFGSIFASASLYLENALQVIYQNTGLSAAFCYPDDDLAWGKFQEQCHLERDRVAINMNGTTFREQLYSQVIAFRYQPDGTLTLENNLTRYVSEAIGYEPDLLVNTSGSLPMRAQIMLGQNSEN